MPQLFITKAKVLGKKKKETTNEPQETLDNVKTSQVNFDIKIAVNDYDDDGYDGYETDAS